MPQPYRTSRNSCHSRLAQHARRTGVGMVICMLLAVGCRKTANEPQVYGALPLFTLTDQQGATITPAKLLGRPVVANFIFTRCKTVCPMLSLKMQRVQSDTASWQIKPVLLSFSVDPQYDTPERLREFAGRFAADPERWHFLTGDPTVIRETVRHGLKMAMEQTGNPAAHDPNITHSGHFILIDRHMQIRGYYDSNDPDRLEALMRDLRTLR